MTDATRSERKIRNCLMCIHCDYSSGDYGYSEMTPGSDASLVCDKNVMRHTIDRRKGASCGNNLFYEVYTREQLREALATAETCKHYEPEEA